MESYSSARAFECPQCGSVYSKQGRCDKDGARLKAADDLREALEIDEPLNARQAVDEMRLGDAA